MGYHPKWLEHFKISPLSLKEWQTEADPGVSLTHSLLISGHLDQDSYIEWAAQFFEIPFIQPEFLVSDEAMKTFQDLVTVYEWRQDFIPLARWGDLLYVACHEPLEIHLPFSVRFVLATAQSMKLAWDMHNVTIIIPQILDETHSSSPELIMMDRGGQADVSVEDVEAIDSFSSENTDQLPPLPIGLEMDEESYHTVVLNRPDGFEVDNLDLPPPLSEEEILPEEWRAHAASEDEVARPEGLLSDTPNDDITGDIPELAGKESLEALPNEMPPPPPDEFLSIPFSNPPSFPTETSFSEDSQILNSWSLKEVTSVRSLIASDEAMTKTIDIATYIGSTGDASCKALERASISAAYDDLDKAESLDDLIKVSFKLMAQHFSNCMILVFSEGQLAPFRWTANWPNVGLRDRPAPVDLLGPSLFRIVFRTSLPYHGYLVSTPTNDQFFKYWNQGELPGHITVMPIIKEGRLFGMLLGTQDRHLINYKFSLRFIEDLVDRFQQKMGRLNLKNVS